MSNIADNIKTVVDSWRQIGWRENPILVANEELAQKARTICKENNIPVKIKVVKAKWKK